MIHAHYEQNSNMIEMYKEKNLNIQKKLKYTEIPRESMWHQGRCKGLDLIKRVPEELWMQVCNTIHEAVIKTIPKKKKCKKAMCLSEEALQTAEKRREI